MSPRLIQLADIPLRDLIPVKVTIKWIANEDHSRWVLRAARGGHYDGSFFKIWNPTYVRRDNVLRAIEAGFYGDALTPALIALVFHRDVCRGYVMKCGVPNRRLNPEFVGLMKAKTHMAGYFHVQFSVVHTMRCGDRLSLLDLEAVCPIAEYANHAGQFDRAEYEQFVANLYKKSTSGIQDSISAADSRYRAVTTGRGSIDPLLRRVEGVVEHAWRRFRTGVRNLHPRIDLIDLGSG